MSLLVHDKPINRVVVRVKTSHWRDKRGFHVRKDINYLNRLCTGHNFLREGGDEPDCLPYIGCPDGIYEVIVTNITRDYESGHVDGWDYKLIPFKGECAS